MTTWTFKGPVAALALFTLTGCEAGQRTKLVEGVLPGTAKQAARPLSRAQMAGDVILVAPSGYCIDRTSLKARFAVMARCDGLGVTLAGSGAVPRGLITVSLTARKPGPLPSAAQTAQATQLVVVDAVEESQDKVTFRAQGRIPVSGLSAMQWRGVAAIGGQTAGIAVYGAEQSEILTSVGRTIMHQMIARSIEATPKSAQTPTKRK